MSQIVKSPSEVLRTPAKTVDQVDKKILSIIKDMETTLLAQKNPDGVGLAAPQIGVSYRIFLIRPITKSGHKSSISLFINPEITHLSRDKIKKGSKNALLEGCLSLPHYYGHVDRSKSVTVKFLDINFAEKIETFAGFAAQIIQHEIDHLDGKLFIDRILEQNGSLYEIHGDDWKKVDI